MKSGCLCGAADERKTNKEEFMIIVTVCKLLMALAVGYYLNKKDIFTKEVNQKLCTFVIEVCLPLIILTSLSEADGDMSKGLLIKFVLTGGAFYCLLPFIAKGINVLTRIPKEDRPVYEQFYIFGNTLYMGYPVAASLYGTGCIFHLSIFHLGFDILYYTYARWQICKGAGTAGGKLSLRELLNPGTVASLMALAMFFTGVKMPGGAAEVCNFIGEMASPLSMVVIGANIGTYSVKSIFRCDKKLYLVAAIRLLIFPVVVYAVMTLLGFDGIFRGSAVISLGMPVAAMVSMGCTEQGYKEELASAGVILTTLLSLPMVPVLLTVMG
ncbi:AEC family transporter [Anaerovoracaceae bacterium 42-11]